MSLHNAASAKPSPEQVQLITDLGGPVAVARIMTELLGKPMHHQTPVNWKLRGIPYRWRAMLAAEARKRKVKIPPNFLGAMPEPAAP